jgi:hypothetical protein
MAAAIGYFWNASSTNVPDVRLVQIVSIQEWLIDESYHRLFSKFYLI